MLNKAIKKAKENKKGFTLAELLIVVAIIAVLVAISIPIFTTQLEKSREAVDAANIRASYAEASATYLTNDGVDALGSVFTVKQKDTSKWSMATPEFPFTVDVTSLTSGKSYQVKVTAGTNGGDPTYSVVEKTK